MSTDILDNKEVGYNKLHKAILHTPHTPEDIHRFIDAGEDVNLKSFNGNTALHFCSYHYHYYQIPDKRYAIMKILVDNGANVNLCNDKGKTPLQIVMEGLDKFGQNYYHYAQKFIALLIDAGADFSCIDIDNYKNLNNLEKEYFSNYIRSRNIKPARK